MLDQTGFKLGFDIKIKLIPFLQLKILTNFYFVYIYIHLSERFINKPARCVKISINKVRPARIQTFVQIKRANKALIEAKILRNYHRQ